MSEEINRYSEKGSIQPIDYYGYLIKECTLDQANKIYIEFMDGTKVLLEDTGQSCCEHRYITTDDDTSVLKGQKLVHIKVKNGPDIEDENNEYHQTCFLEIQGNQSAVTFVTHNEHNGYYGGFCLEFKAVN